MSDVETVGVKAKALALKIIEVIEDYDVAISLVALAGVTGACCAATPNPDVTCDRVADMIRAVARKDRIAAVDESTERRE